MADFVRAKAIDNLFPVLMNLISPPPQNQFLLFQKREPDDQLAAESFVPGTGRVYVKTWGCAHNSSDSEYMAGQLAAEVSRILVRVFFISVPYCACGFEMQF